MKYMHQVLLPNALWRWLDEDWAVAVDDVSKFIRSNNTVGANSAGTNMGGASDPDRLQAPSGPIPMQKRKHDHYHDSENDEGDRLEGLGGSTPGSLSSSIHSLSGSPSTSNPLLTSLSSSTSSTLHARGGGSLHRRPSLEAVAAENVRSSSADSPAEQEGVAGDVPMSTPQDDEMWEYARTMKSGFHKGCGATDTLRRRKWSRTRAFQGPHGPLCACEFCSLMQFTPADGVEQRNTVITNGLNTLLASCIEYLSQSLNPEALWIPLAQAQCPFHRAHSATPPPPPHPANLYQPPLTSVPQWADAVSLIAHAGGLAATGLGGIVTAGIGNVDQSNNKTSLLRSYGARRNLNWMTIDKKLETLRCIYLYLRTRPTIEIHHRRPKNQRQSQGQTLSVAEAVEAASESVAAIKRRVIVDAYTYLLSRLVDLGPQRYQDTLRRLRPQPTSSSLSTAATATTAAMNYASKNPKSDSTKENKSGSSSSVSSSSASTSSGSSASSAALLAVREAVVESFGDDDTVEDSESKAVADEITLVCSLLERLAREERDDERYAKLQMEQKLNLLEHDKMNSSRVQRPEVTSPNSASTAESSACSRSSASFLSRPGPLLLICGCHTPTYLTAREAISCLHSALAIQHLVAFDRSFHPYADALPSTWITATIPVLFPAASLAAALSFSTALPDQTYRSAPHVPDDPHLALYNEQNLRPCVHKPIGFFGSGEPRLSEEGKGVNGILREWPRRLAWLRRHLGVLAEIEAAKLLPSANMLRATFLRAYAFVCHHHLTLSFYAHGLAPFPLHIASPIALLVPSALSPPWQTEFSAAFTFTSNPVALAIDTPTTSPGGKAVNANSTSSASSSSFSARIKARAGIFFGSSGSPVTVSNDVPMTGTGAGLTQPSPVHRTLAGPVAGTGAGTPTLASGRGPALATGTAINTHSSGLGARSNTGSATASGSLYCPRSGLGAPLPVIVPGPLPAASSGVSLWDPATVRDAHGHSFVTGIVAKASESLDVKVFIAALAATVDFHHELRRKFGSQLPLHTNALAPGQGRSTSVATRSSAPSKGRTRSASVLMAEATRRRGHPFGLPSTLSTALGDEHSLALDYPFHPYVSYVAAELRAEFVSTLIRSCKNDVVFLPPYVINSYLSSAPQPPSGPATGQTGPRPASSDSSSSSAANALASFFSGSSSSSSFSSPFSSSSSAKNSRVLGSTYFHELLHARIRTFPPLLFPQHSTAAGALRPYTPAPTPQSLALSFGAGGETGHGSSSPSSSSFPSSSSGTPTSADQNSPNFGAPIVLSSAFQEASFLREDSLRFEREYRQFGIVNLAATRPGATLSSMNDVFVFAKHVIEKQAAPLLSHYPPALAALVRSLVLEISRYSSFLFQALASPLAPPPLYPPPFFYVANTPSSTAFIDARRRYRQPSSNMTSPTFVSSAPGSSPLRSGPASPVPLSEEVSASVAEAATGILTGSGHVTVLTSLARGNPDYPTFVTPVSASALCSAVLVANTADLAAKSLLSFTDWAYKFVGGEQAFQLYLSLHDGPAVVGSAAAPSTTPSISFADTVEHVETGFTQVMQLALQSLALQLLPRIASAAALHVSSIASLSTTESTVLSRIADLVAKGGIASTAQPDNTSSRLNAVGEKATGLIDDVSLQTSSESHSLVPVAGFLSTPPSANPASPQSVHSPLSPTLDDLVRESQATQRRFSRHLGEPRRLKHQPNLLDADAEEEGDNDVDADAADAGAGNASRAKYDRGPRGHEIGNERSRIFDNEDEEDEREQLGLSRQLSTKDLTNGSRLHQDSRTNADSVASSEHPAAAGASSLSGVNANAGTSGVGKGGSDAMAELLSMYSEMAGVEITKEEAPVPLISTVTPQPASATSSSGEAANANGSSLPPLPSEAVVAVWDVLCGIIVPSARRREQQILLIRRAATSVESVFDEGRRTSSIVSGRSGNPPVQHIIDDSPALHLPPEARSHPWLSPCMSQVVSLAFVMRALGLDSRQGKAFLNMMVLEVLSPALVAAIAAFRPLAFPAFYHVPAPVSDGYLQLLKEYAGPNDPSIAMSSTTSTSSLGDSRNSSVPSALMVSFTSLNKTSLSLLSPLLRAVVVDLHALLDISSSLPFLGRLNPAPPLLTMFRTSDVASDAVPAFAVAQAASKSLAQHERKEMAASKARHELLVHAEATGIGIHATLAGREASGADTRARASLVVPQYGDDAAWWHGLPGLLDAARKVERQATTSRKFTRLSIQRLLEFISLAPWAAATVMACEEAMDAAMKESETRSPDEPREGDMIADSVAFLDDFLSPTTAALPQSVPSSRQANAGTDCKHPTSTNSPSVPAKLAQAARSMHGLFRRVSILQVTPVAVEWLLRAMGSDARASARLANAYSVYVDQSRISVKPILDAL